MSLSAQYSIYKDDDGFILDHGGLFGKEPLRMEFLSFQPMKFHLQEKDSKKFFATWQEEQILQ